MIIYHGSYIKIEKPEIIIQEKGRDFGFGFYTTTIKEQAERWAIRTARLLSRQSGKNENAVINIYDYDENSAKDLNIKSFPNADLEWLELVIKCRSDLKFSHGFDIVSGKIANDNVGETIEYVLAGIMRKEDAIERLKFEKINDQICFCTEKSLKTISFKESIIIKTVNWSDS
ncbi:DUF3990 domain-containing protein [Treponema sp.]|uniref:DUF3990 domain-containing protein n=1 Tax=Treponema sp. TaxID=166 RepID=UPI00298E545C|nr:DUF3990 domain-containing protein [Treponema sp.]